MEKIPWSRKWRFAPALMPGKLHGQRSLAGYSLWGRKESQTRLRAGQQHHFLYFLVCGCAGPPLLCGLSLVVASGGSSPGGACRLLTAAASPVTERRLWGRGLWGLPRPGIKPGSPTLASGFSTTEPPGKSLSESAFTSSAALRGRGSYGPILWMTTLWFREAENLP